MRPDRAVGLCLIALVLAQAGFFAGAPSDFAGSPVVLNRGARIPSVMSGTRDVVVPDGKANEPGLTVQDVSPVLGTGWNALSFEPGGLTPPDVQVAVGPAHVVEAVNIALGVYSKEGVPLVTYGLSTFFATGSDFLSDPPAISPPGRSWSQLRGRRIPRSAGRSIESLRQPRPNAWINRFLESER